jgi:hypothetical protein
MSYFWICPKGTCWQGPNCVHYEHENYESLIRYSAFCCCCSSLNIFLLHFMKTFRLGPLILGCSFTNLDIFFEVVLHSICVCVCVCFFFFFFTL